MLYCHENKRMKSYTSIFKKLARPQKRRGMEIKKRRNFFLHNFTPYPTIQGWSGLLKIMAQSRGFRL